MPSLTLSSSNSDHSREPPTHHEDSATKDVVQLQILKLLKKMQLGMKHSAPSYIPSTPNNTRHGFRKSKTPDTQTCPPRNRKPNCCWTHGASIHVGNDLSRQA